MASTDEDKTAALEAALGYGFSDRSLIERALLHRSACKGNDPGYERFEFLGDRVLGLIVADMLLKAFPDEAEGSLARRLNALVRMETLAEVAGSLGIGAYVTLGPSEETSGRSNPSILSDVCEALIGALYLDGGLDAARAFITRHWSERLNRSDKPPRDAKSSLQEWAMSRRFDLPLYEEVSRSGPAHSPVFRMRVKVGKFTPEEAEAPSKRQAEQKAAKALLKRLEKGAS